MEVLAKDLDWALCFIEETVKRHVQFNDDIEREFRTAGHGIPPDLSSSMIQATRSLLTPATKGKGVFLVVTGIDRTGKETQCFNPKKLPGVTSIHEHLTTNSFQTLPIGLPSYNTLLGGLIAAYLNAPEQRVVIEGELPRDRAWVLWGLDRAQHNGTVQEWLRTERNVVLSRRWMESNMAYQVANEINPQRMLEFERNILKQDHTIVLDAPIDPLFDRINYSDEKSDKYEQREFMERVRQNYLNLPRYYPFGQFIVLNGAASPEKVNIQVLRALEQMGFDSNH